MKERNFNRNAFARAVFFFFQTQTLSLSRRTEQQGSEKTFSTTTTTNAHSRRGMVPTTLSFYPKSISPEQKSDDRADARDDDVHDDTKSAKREFETTKTVTHLLGVLDHHRWGSPRRTRTHHHHRFGCV
jgi:hypothetical protein